MVREPVVDGPVRPGAPRASRCRRQPALHLHDVRHGVRGPRVPRMQLHRARPISSARRVVAGLLEAERVHAEHVAVARHRLVPGGAPGRPGPGAASTGRGRSGRSGRPPGRARRAGTRPTMSPYTSDRRGEVAPSHARAAAACCVRARWLARRCLDRRNALLEHRQCATFRDITARAARRQCPAANLGSLERVDRGERDPRSTDESGRWRVRASRAKPGGG